MVGASNSPVVGSAIPSVFGLVVIAIGAMKNWGHPHKKVTDDAQLETTASPTVASADLIVP